MSRTQVPLEKLTEATARVPMDDMMTGAASNVHVVITNSGLLADSVVPAGETVIVHEPADTIALKSVSTSPTPYERYRSRLTATLCKPFVACRPVSASEVDSRSSKPSMTSHFDNWSLTSIADPPVGVIEQVAPDRNVLVAMMAP